MRQALLLVALAAVAAAGPPRAPIRFDKAAFEAVMAQDPRTALSGSEDFPAIRRKVLVRVRDVAQAFLSQASELHEVFGVFHGSVGRALEALAGPVGQEGRNAVDEALTALSEGTGQLPSRLQQLREYRQSFNASSADDFRPFGLEVRGIVGRPPSAALLTRLPRPARSLLDPLQKYPYFGFLPTFEGALVPGAGPMKWSAPCFGASQAEAEADEDGESLNLRFEMANPSSLLCVDHYMLATIDGLWTTTFFRRGAHSLRWRLPESARPAERWDTKEKGVRVFRFRDGPIQTVIDILDTASLFLPAETEAGVDAGTDQRNTYFMRHYAAQPMVPRTAGDVEVDESLIQSGDFFGVLRLDGLDPMLAWAMGSTTGHTTVALRMDGELYVAESTVADSYWPTNGIQATPYRQWLKQAKHAGFHVVWAPLTPEARARFNETAAVEFFRENAGLNYGYNNLLFGWLDTVSDNYPCLPPDYKHCMSWEVVEILYAAMDRLAPATADQLFGQALNHRLGTDRLRAPELLRQTHARGIAAHTLPTLVEQDAWRYRTTKNGKPVEGRSMVCCVFVCHVWKAAGLFANFTDAVNCGELTNWDDYALNVLQARPDRPAACRAADPDNALCQLMGDHKVTLNNLSSKAPYPHMAEHCPSKAPHYEKPPRC